MVPVVPLFSTENSKGKILALSQELGCKINVTDKIWDRKSSKSEVISRCGGDEKTEGPRRTDKSRTLKKNKKKKLAAYLPVNMDTV